MATGWHLHVHPSEKFNLDQDYAFDNKRDARHKAKDLIEQWILEVEDC